MFTALAAVAPITPLATVEVESLEHAVGLGEENGGRCETTDLSITQGTKRLEELAPPNHPLAMFVALANMLLEFEGLPTRHPLAEFMLNRSRHPLCILSRCY